MPELPPDLSRLGDALERAVAGAIDRRRRAQLRAAWALGAVAVTVPMAAAATHVTMGQGDSRMPGATPQPLAVAPSKPVSRGSAATRVRRGDRVPAGAASGRVLIGPSAPPHPLDSMPPPVTARAGRWYDAGVATERVDRRPPFNPRTI